ncbi:MAG: ATP-binding protein [Bacteroidia bacterium]
MDVKEKLENNNEFVKSKMIDEAYFTFSILAFFSIILVTFRAIEIGFTLSYFVQLPIAISVWLSYFYRTKLSTEYKTYKLIAALVLILIAGLFNFGFFASTKHYLILLPVISSFLLPPKTTIKLFIVLLLIYSGFGLAFLNGWINLKINPNDFVNKQSTWLVDIFVISGSAWIILRIVQQYYSVLNNQYDTITKINEDLSDKEEKQRVLFESMNEAVFLIENDVVVDCNTEAKKLFGEKINNELISNIFPRMQSSGRETHLIWDEKINEIKQGNKPAFTLNLITNQDKEAICDIGLNQLELKHHTYIQVIIRDITQRKKREDELRQYRIELEKRSIELQLINEDLKKSNQQLQDKNLDLENTLDILNKAKVQLVESEKMASIGILTAGVAHEINNPLNFIKTGLYGIESIIEDDELTDSSEIKKEIKSIASKMGIGVDKVAEIVKSLNHFSRNNQLEFQKCSLNKILSNCLSILNHEYKNKVAIKQTYLKNNIDLFGNESKLHQVFLNLILNSIQSIETTGEIEIDSKLHQNEAIITITDTGKGIPEEFKNKIFDPFFTTKPAGKGTGLGLSIVLQIIKDHQGDITFASAEGKGTLVTLILPTAQTANDRKD